MKARTGSRGRLPGVIGMSRSEGSGAWLCSTVSVISIREACLAQQAVHGIHDHLPLGAAQSGSGNQPQVPSRPESRQDNAQRFSQPALSAVALNRAADRLPGAETDSNAREPPWPAD